MKTVTYEDVMKTGFELLREESDAVYGCDEKTKAESAVHMMGIIDTLSALCDQFEKEGN